jgi:hypothetical protein
MFELPTVPDLKRLPRRALAAYLIRCVRRIQPFYDSSDQLCPAEREELFKQVELLITMAERFAAGDDSLLALDTQVIATKGTKCVLGADWGAAKVVANVATTAAMIAGKTDESFLGSVHAAVTSISEVDSSVEVAAVIDYRKLLELISGIYPDLGDPIAPTETGPLGPLWPNGLLPNG